MHAYIYQKNPHLLRHFSWQFIDQHDQKLKLNGVPEIMIKKIVVFDIIMSILLYLLNYFPWWSKKP